jgi:hypothetical protein
MSQMAGPDAVILELPESFEFAFGCSGGDRFVMLLLRLHHLGRDSIPNWVLLVVSPFPAPAAFDPRHSLL